MPPFSCKFSDIVLYKIDYVVDNAGDRHSLKCTLSTKTILTPGSYEVSRAQGAKLSKAYSKMCFFKEYKG